MAVDPVNNQTPAADPAGQAEFDAALNQSLEQGMVMIGQFVIMPMIKEATGEADTFSEDE